MATVNIGNLTFTHRGDYAGGTAYAKNDVVYYATNGNAYIAKQATTGNAPTNGTYWSQFAAGSGGIWNAGLSLGSAGQSVKVNAAGNALEFGTISSDYVKLAETNVTSGVANVAFEHGTGDIDFTSGAYQYFKVFFKDVHMAGDNERIYAYVKASGGSYLSSSNEYRENRMSISGSSVSDLCNVDATSARIFNGGTDNSRTAYSTMQGELTLMNFDDSDNYSTIIHHTHMTFIDSTTNDFMSTGAHTVRVTGVHDGIKFEGSGNINRGKFSLYGIK